MIIYNNTNLIIFNLQFDRNIIPITLLINKNGKWRQEPFIVSWDSVEYVDINNSRNYYNCQYKFYYFKINPQINEREPRVTS